MARRHVSDGDFSFFYGDSLTTLPNTRFCYTVRLTPIFRNFTPALLARRREAFESVEYRLLAEAFRRIPVLPIVSLLDNLTYEAPVGFSFHIYS